MVYFGKRWTAGCGHVGSNRCSNGSWSSEELKACGFENFIVLGSCGVLDKSLAADKIILPSSALRDEGTGYHYAPASEEISYDPALLLTMEKALDQAGIEHVRAKTWTTDAFFRETAAKVKRRPAAGAMVVDMEASAIMAWANFRQAKVYQFSTRQTMWTTTRMNGMPVERNGWLTV